MNQEIIKDGDIILAIIIKNQEFKQGLDFLTKDIDALQVGTWHYQKGQILKAHIHLTAERTNTNVQEFVFVKSGKLRADLYNQADQLVAQKELTAGDIIILMSGGHGYEILEDNTQVLETKNGPYIGLEKDKRLIPITCLAGKAGK